MHVSDSGPNEDESVHHAQPARRWYIWFCGPRPESRYWRESCY